TLPGRLRTPTTGSTMPGAATPAPRSPSAPSASTADRAYASIRPQMVVNGSSEVPVTSIRPTSPSPVTTPILVRVPPTSKPSHQPPDVSTTAALSLPSPLMPASDRGRFPDLQHRAALAQPVPQHRRRDLARVRPCTDRQPGGGAHGLAHRH